MIHLTHIPNMFRMGERIKRDVPAARNIGELQAREFPERKGVHWIVDGHPVDAKFPLWPGRKVIAITNPSGAEFLGIIIYAIVAGLISAGISFAISLLMGRPPRGRDNPDGSPTYGWDGITNTATAGNPIAEIFGQNRVGGQIIGNFRRCEHAYSKTQHLYLLIALGGGPIQSIGQYDHDVDNVSVGSSRFVDDFEIYRDDLGDSANWDRIYGVVSSCEVESGICRHNRTNDGGYVVEGDYFQSANNIFAKARRVWFVTDSVMAVAINVADANNYYAARWETSGTARFVKMKGGVETELYSRSGLDSNFDLEIKRIDGQVHCLINGVLEHSQAEDTDLDSTLFGILVFYSSQDGFEFNGSQLDDFSGGAVEVDGDFIQGCEINKIEATTFDGIRASLRLGRETQASFGGDFDLVIQPYIVDIKLTTDKWTHYKCRGGITGAYININFPKGLFDQSGGSGIAERTQHIKAQYRAASWAPWLDVPGGTSTVYPGAHVFTDDQASPFDRTIFATDLYGGETEGVEFRFKVMVASNDQLMADDVYLSEINEISTNPSKTYPNTAVVAMRIKASEQLRGARPTITFMCKGKHLPVLSAGNPPRVQHKYSTNPAWVACYMALDKRNGLGNWFSLDDLDAPAWIRFAQHCDKVLQYREVEDEPTYITNETEDVAAGQSFIVLTDDDVAANFDEGDFVALESEGVNQVVTKTDLTGGRWKLTLVFAASRFWPAGSSFAKVRLGANIVRKRAEFNGVFDARTNAWEALLQVCRIGRGVPYVYGNKLSVRIETEGEVQQHFNDSSIIAGSLKISYLGRNEQVERVEYQFADKANGYERDSAVASIPRVFLDHAEITEQLNGDPGTTDRSQAAAEANYYLRAKSLIRKKIEFAVPLEGMAAEPGDVISVGSTLPSWSKTVSRANGTLASFTIDHDLTIPVGETYVVMAKTPTKQAAIQATITLAAGSYPSGTAITTNGSAMALSDAPVAIGKANEVVTKWRIVNITLRDDFTVTIEAVQYVADLYRLIGWPYLETIEAPPPSGCIPPGSYIIDYSDHVADCDPPGTCGGIACMWVPASVIVSVSGDAAACVEIISIGEGGVAFTVSDGCSGEFCISITVTFELVCCAGETCCTPIPSPECDPTEHEYCFTVCE